MVSCDQNQSFFGVVLGEVDGYLYRVGQGQGVMNRGGGIVGMAGPVDLAPFAHHEKAFVVVKYLDTLFYIVCQGPHIVSPVQLIGHGVRVGQMLVHDDNGAGSDLLRFRLSFYHSIACLFGQIIQVVLITVCSVWLQQGATGKVIKS